LADSLSTPPPEVEDAVGDVDREAATKAQVLGAAERLFALHGFQNVSVRDITAEAGVNLASVNYHFGSKDALIFEIFRRRTSELNRERARMLHEAADRHGLPCAGRRRPAGARSRFSSSSGRARRAPSRSAKSCAQTSRT